MIYLFWKLRVCLYVLWFHRHWPWGDLSEATWRETYEWGYDPWETFLEGWCRDS